MTIQLLNQLILLNKILGPFCVLSIELNANPKGTMS